MQQPFPFPLRLQVVERRFPFRRPATTSRGVYHERRVWYIVVTARDGRPGFVGIGECAPLYDLSADYTPDYPERLSDICRTMETTGQVDDEVLRRLPSMRFGLETALLSAEASLRGHHTRLIDSAFARGEAGIAINGLVWMGSREEMAQRMEEKLAAGYRCVKLKIGGIAFDDEVALLDSLRRRFPRRQVELRVDANGAFAPDEALERLRTLARFDLHSIEQPIRAGQWEEMARLCRESPVPIALDEELIGVNATTEKAALLDTIRPAYLVLKPSLHGGLAGTAEWMRLAAERDIPYWVTSALETNVGLNALAQWTAVEPQRIWQEHAPQGGHRRALPEVHGLGTGQLLVDNFRDTRLHIHGDRLWNADDSQCRFVAQYADFCRRWHDTAVTAFTVKTSGSTGEPKVMQVEKRYAEASARATCAFLGLPRGAEALVAMPLEHIAAQMQVVRTQVWPLKAVVVAPTAHPYARLDHAPWFAALTPHQVWATLQVPHEARLLARTACLLIGGGSISDALAERLSSLPVQVWSSYGMTETLSHIALRRVNGPQPDAAYRPLPGVRLTTDSRGCLVIDAPHIGVSALPTHDVVTLRADGSFTVIGRTDNVVCSGGLKFAIEPLEQRLHLDTTTCVLTAVPDTQYGQALTLVYTAVPPAVRALDTSSSHTPADTARAWRAYCAARLSRYEVPKHFIAVTSIPRTPTGKPARVAIARLAAARLENDDN